MSGLELLHVLNHHRYATLRQLSRLMGDPDPDVYQGPTYDLLRDLQAARLVEHAPVEGRGVHVWFTSERGLKLIPSDRRREYVPNFAAAGGLDYRHSWGVGAIAISFLEAARARGDDCGPFALEREVLMKDAPRNSRSTVIADGLLYYRTLEPPAVRAAVVEFDRSTSPGRIAERLHAYSEIRSRKGRWSRVLPGGWPLILFVVASDPVARRKAGERNWAGDARLGQNRADGLASYLAGLDAKGERWAGTLPVLFASLPELVRSGPFAPIWRRPGNPERLDWLGQPVMVVVDGKRKRSAG